MAEQTNFMKNLALAGGALMLNAVPRPWAKSWPRRNHETDQKPWSYARGTGTESLPSALHR